eukprot:COSAG02_NODE_6136_length_3775_cov_2.403871_2_plen_40_part_00
MAQRSGSDEDGLRHLSEHIKAYNYEEPLSFTRDYRPRDS